MVANILFFIFFLKLTRSLEWNVSSSSVASPYGGVNRCASIYIILVTLEARTVIFTARELHPWKIPR